MLGRPEQKIEAQNGVLYREDSTVSLSCQSSLGGSSGPKGQLVHNKNGSAHPAPIIKRWYHTNEVTCTAYQEGCTIIEGPCSREEEGENVSGRNIGWDEIPDSSRR